MSCVQNKAVESIVEKLATSIAMIPFIVVGNIERLHKQSALYLLDAQVERDPRIVTLRQSLTCAEQRLQLLKRALQRHLTRRFIGVRDYRKQRLTELLETLKASCPSRPTPIQKLEHQNLVQCEESIFSARDPWKLMWKGFVHHRFKNLAIDTHESTNEVSGLRGQLNIQLEEVRTELISTTRVILCTTQVAPSLSPGNMPPYLEELEPIAVRLTTVILDEAGTVPESKLPMLASLDLKRVIAIGDQQQLMPFTYDHKQSTSGFFHRLAKSLVSIAPVPMLTEQYRMHPAICDFVSNNYYEGSLVTPEIVAAKRSAEAHSGLVWVDYPEFAEDFIEKRKSFSNDMEVQLVVDYLQLLTSNGVDIGSGPEQKTVMIITFYKPQKFLLAEKIRSEGFEIPNDMIVTVDASQGSEADIVILSCVRANPEHRIGHCENSSRVCVGTSRAKQLLIVVGHSRTMTCDPQFKNLFSRAKTD